MRNKNKNFFGQGKEGMGKAMLALDILTLLLLLAFEV